MYLAFPIESTAYHKMKAVHDDALAGKRTLPKPFFDRMAGVVAAVEKRRATTPSDDYAIEMVMACVEHYDYAVACVARADGLKDVAAAAKKMKHLPDLYLSTWTMGATVGHRIALRRADGVLELHDWRELQKAVNRPKGTPFDLVPHFGSVSADGAVTKGKGWEDSIAVALIDVFITKAQKEDA